MLSGFAQAAPFYEKVNLLSKKQASGGWGAGMCYFNRLWFGEAYVEEGFDA